MRFSMPTPPESIISYPVSNVIEALDWIRDHTTGDERDFRVVEIDIHTYEGLEQVTIKFDLAWGVPNNKETP